MFFTQKHANAIAKKLGCSFKEGAKHTLAQLFDEQGKLLASFGIRRGSGEQGHGYIPKELQLTQKKAKELHDCTLSKEEYFQILREKNPEPEKESESGSTDKK